MTVVGEAFVRFKAIDDITPALTGVGQKAEAAAGQAAEKTSGRFRAAMRSMVGTLSSAFGPAFEPIQEVMDKLDGIGAAAQNMRNRVGKSLLGIGGAATATGVLLTTMGDKDKISMSQLQKAVENAGGQWSKYREETEKTVKHEEHYGHTAQSTAGALNVLITRTGKIEESYKNMSLVTDLAANKHISLSAAAGIVARVMNGNTRVLKQYGIDQAAINKLTDTAGKKAKEHAMTLLQEQDATNKARIMTLKEKDAAIQATLATTKDKDERAKLHAVLAKDRLERQKLTDAISRNKEKEKELKDEIKNSTDAHAKGAAAVELLAKKMKGQADVAADSFTGKMKEARAKVEDFIATWGQRLGPAITAAGPILMGVGAIIESGIIGKLGKAVQTVGKFISIQRIAAVATRVWAAAQWVLDAAMDAFGGPILLIIIAIGALVAAVVLAYMKFKPFREIVNAIGREIKTIFLTAVHAVIAAFRWLIGAFEAVWKTVWNIVKRYGIFILAAVAPFIGIPLIIMRYWKQIIGFFRSMWSTVASTFSHFVQTILNFIRNLWTTAVSFVRRMISDIVGFFASLPGRAASAIGSIVGRVVGIISNMARNAVSAVRNFVSNAASAAGQLIGKVASALGGLAGTVRSKISGAFSNVKNMITGAFSGAAGWLVDAGRQVIDGLVNGIQGAIGKLTSAVGKIGGLIKHIKGPKEKDLVLLSEEGQAIMTGLINGINSRMPHLHGALRNVTKNIKLGPTDLGARVPTGAPAGIGNIYNLFPNATIHMAEESPQALADRLKFAIQASRM